MKEITVKQERLNKLKEHLLNTYHDGKFSANTYAFGEVLGMQSQTTRYLDYLIKEGFLIRTKKATQQGKDWFPAEYEIVSRINNANSKGNFEVYNAIMSIDDEPSKSEETLKKIDINDYIEEKFNNVSMRLYKTEQGYVIPISDIVKGLNVDRQLIHQMINKNEELFQDFIVNVTLTTVTNGKNKCLTRDGVIGLLMKISYNRLTPDKKKLVLDFQKWAIEKLGQLISSGETKISKEEQKDIQTKVASSVGVSEEDIENVFTYIQKSIDEKLQKVKLIVKEKDEEARLARLERDNAIERENRILGRVTQMVDQRVDLMMRQLA